MTTLPIADRVLLLLVIRTLGILAGIVSRWFGLNRLLHFDLTVIRKSISAFGDYAVSGLQAFDDLNLIALLDSYSDGFLVSAAITVSYTHLTLPTIYSV